MGLDMYVYSVDPDDARITKDGRLVNAKGKPIEDFFEEIPHAEIAYWRKFNALHGWFIDEYERRSGIRKDNAELPISKEMFEHFKQVFHNTVHEVLFEYPKGQTLYAKNFLTYVAKNPDEGIPENILQVKEEYAEPFPDVGTLVPTSGFFFGNTSFVDPYYFAGTRIFIGDAEQEYENSNILVYYSSW